MDNGVSKCGRKTALSVFFALSLLAFTFCLLSLLSPSWQFVYLENGRTEHHHGLWLDCKRDYSFDYGRKREEYETLYRRDLEGSPFAMFFLPQLQCVYKFDYYIDPEDLYDHNHDENRIQNDANQHLFLGWKIAVLSAIGVCVLFSFASFLLGICSFCHRTFICACTVLVTIAAILSTTGVILFYMFANYQDNRVIQDEDDDTNEQQFGWAFHFQVIGAILQWFAAFMGCCVTSISFNKKRAKLVKIEVVEGGDDSQLLNSTRTLTSSAAPFKRSFSAVYRVDSQALRQWERDYMKGVKMRQEDVSQESNFKRTSSVPNFSKKHRKSERKRMKQQQHARSNNDIFSSTSNFTESTNVGGSITTLDTRQTFQSAQTAPPTVPSVLLKPAIKLKSALKTPQQARRTADDTESTYDLTAEVSSIGSKPKSVAYDSVYEEIGQEDYLEPNSVKQRNSMCSFGQDIAPNMPPSKKALLPSLPVNSSSQSIPVAVQKTTLIDDIAWPSSSSDDIKKDVETQSNLNLIRIRERQERLERLRVERNKVLPTIEKSTPPPASTAPPVPEKPKMSIRDFGIDLSKQKNGYCTKISKDAITTFGVESDVDRTSSPTIKYADIENRPLEAPTASPLRYTSVRSEAQSASSATSAANTSLDQAPLTLNTFSDHKSRSITNLTFRPGATSSSGELFERPDSVVSSVSKTSKPPLIMLNPNVQRKLLLTVPDEVDRSVGSSTMVENDAMSTASYARDAEIRLNLFLNDPQHKDETSV